MCRVRSWSYSLHGVRETVGPASDAMSLAGRGAGAVCARELVSQTWPSAPRHHGRPADAVAGHVTSQPSRASQLAERRAAERVEEQSSELLSWVCGCRDETTVM